MNTYIVSFFGHRMVDNGLEIEDKLERLILSDSIAGDAG